MGDRTSTVIEAVQTLSILCERGKSAGDAAAVLACHWLRSPNSASLAQLPIFVLISVTCGLWVQRWEELEEYLVILPSVLV